MKVPTEEIPSIEEYIEKANEWLNFRRKESNTATTSYYNYLNEVTLLKYWLIPYYAFLNGKIQTKQYGELNQRLQDSMQAFLEETKNDEKSNPSEKMLEAAKKLKSDTIEYCYEFGISTEIINGLLKHRTIEEMIKDKGEFEK